MIILGIDTGTAATGWGVVEANRTLRAKGFGCIKPGSRLSFPNRLLKIHLGLKEVISQYNPQVAAIEEGFFSRYRKTAMLVGQARGVAMLTCIQAGLKIFEYLPLEVKQALTGFGWADKLQLQKMVKGILRMSKIPKPDDAADALAVAICYAHSRGREILEKE